MRRWATVIDSAEWVDQRPISLSPLEFDVLWEHCEFGPLPMVIKVPSPGKTRAERTELAAVAWTGLGARGLGDGQHPHPELRAMLGMLAEPASEVDARIWLGYRVRALAAARDGRATLAVLRGGEITLRAISPAALARAVVDLLPTAPAGPGHSVTVPSASLGTAAKSAGASVDRLDAELRALGVRADDATALARMVRDAGHRGQFGAAYRDRWGRRVRAGRVIGFFDTSRGRYLQVRSEADNGDAWSTVAPTDARRLTQQIDTLT